jgi:ribose transport system substrate-binding protein
LNHTFKPLTPPPARKSAPVTVKGANPPKVMIMPVATVTQDNLKDYVDMPSGFIVSPSYSQDWVEKNLLSKK